MRAIVVYESMFGSTREVAEAIGRGLASSASVDVVNVNHADPASVSTDDLLIVGGPTHVHGLSRPESRAEAVVWSKGPEADKFNLEPDTPGIGIREWLQQLEVHRGRFAAFDTRADFPRLISGAASAAIDRALRKAGLSRVVPPASFLITGKSRIGSGELARAEAWGEEIGRRILEGAA